MTVRNKQLLAELKQECTECELCDMPCKFINFKCGDSEDGSMAEVSSVCRKCHDELSMCGCPRKKGGIGKGVWIT